MTPDTQAPLIDIGGENLGTIGVRVVVLPRKADAQDMIADTDEPSDLSRRRNPLGGRAFADCELPRTAEDWKAVLRLPRQRTAARRLGQHIHRAAARIQVPP